MANSIIVNTDSLRKASSSIEKTAGDYQNTYNKLYDEVNTMASAWKGTDDTSFTNQINGFKDDFQKLADLMKKYATYLTNTAKSYEDTQNKIANDAKALIKDYF